MNTQSLNEYKLNLKLAIYQMKKEKIDKELSELRLLELEINKLK
jgi:hypothetical protein